MLILNKIIPVFFLPVGVVLLLLVYALVTHKRWPVGVALCGLYCASAPFVGDRLIGWLEGRYPAVAIAQVESADAIVVLGGIFGPPAPEGTVPNLSESVERLEAGIVLMQANKAPRLIFTGGRLPWENRIRLEGEDSKAQAMARGIPSDKILVTREVANTADEAQAVAGLMRTLQLRRVILVTTAWHMPRAARLFKKAGIECIIFPVDFRCDASRPFTLLDFIPKVDALHNTETALREYYGYAFYVATGR